MPSWPRRPASDGVFWYDPLEDLQSPRFSDSREIRARPALTGPGDVIATAVEGAGSGPGCGESNVSTGITDGRGICGCGLFNGTSRNSTASGFPGAIGRGGTVTLWM